MSGIIEFDLKFAACLLDDQACELEGNTSCQPSPDLLTGESPRCVITRRI